MAERRPCLLKGSLKDAKVASATSFIFRFCHAMSGSDDGTACAAKFGEWTNEYMKQKAGRIVLNICDTMSVSDIDHATHR